MKKTVYYALLICLIFTACGNRKELKFEGHDNKQNPKIKITNIEKVLDFESLLCGLSVIFISENDQDLGVGFYTIKDDGNIIYGYGTEYVKIVLLKEVYEENKISLYFSYVLYDGRQVEPADYYRVTVTKDEVLEVYNKYKAGDIKYYVLEKEREFLGYELPPELEGIELPWN